MRLMKNELAPVGKREGEILFRGQHAEDIDVKTSAGTYRLSGGDSVTDTEKKQACARSVRCIFRRDIFASDGRFFGAVGRGDVLAFKIRSVCCRGSAGHGDICRFQRDIFACTVRVDGRKVGEDNEKIRNMMLTSPARRYRIQENKKNQRGK